MNDSVVRRRLTWLEIPLLLIVFILFYFVTDKKDIGYAVGVILAIGILALVFFRPRYGLLCAMALWFTESTINVLNALAEVAAENHLTGVPPLVQSQWFAWGVLIIYVVLLLSYFCRKFLSGAKPEPMSGIEWVLLLPLIMALTFIPVSLTYGNGMMEYTMDIIPMCIYGGIVILARIFFGEGDTRKSRYYLLDWFIIINILILIPLWVYNIAYQPWRNGYVGIAAIRYGTGPYDFNFFLAPLLGMILTYDDQLPLKKRRFYQFAFFLSLARIMVSMFRGAMGGTFIAIIIASFLVDRARRLKWNRSLLIFAASVVVIGGLLIATVPVVRTTFNVALVRRVTQALGKGAGSTSLEFRELETAKAMDDIAKRPFMGYGPGALITKNFNIDDFARKELYLHSAYVWFWYKMGIPGLAVLAAFCIGIYVTCARLLRRKLYPADRGWVTGTLAATIAMLPVIHYNNLLIRSQGAYALTLLLFGLSLIVMRYRGIPRDELPPAEGEQAA